MQNKTKLIILCLLIFTFIITNFDFKDRGEAPKANVSRKIPYKITEYSGKDLEIPEKVNNIISPEELVMRAYEKNNRVINLAVVVSEDRDDLHAPEICYKLQGFRFAEEESLVISDCCKITQVRTFRDEEPYIFHFYYTDMKKVYPDRSEFMFNLMVDRVLQRAKKKYALIIAFSRASNREDLKLYTEELNGYILR